MKKHIDIIVGALVVLLVIGSVTVIQAENSTIYVPSYGRWQDLYFTRDTNSSGGLDTNDAGMQYDTVQGDTMQIPLIGDKTDIFYELNALQHTDNRCSLFVWWVWGCDDTNRILPRSGTGIPFNGTQDTIAGIDSTYDSTMVMHNILKVDSLMYMDWVKPVIRIGMHVWNDADTNGSGRLNETSTKIQYRAIVRYTD